MTVHAKVTLNGTLPCGEFWEAGFVLTDDEGADVGLTQARDAADGFVAAMGGAGPALKAQYDPNTHYNPPRIQLFDDATGALGARIVGSESWAGTLGDFPPLPPQVAVCVTIRPDRAVTKKHGRFYLPGTVGDSSESRGRIRGETLTAFQAALGNAAVAMRADWATARIGFATSDRMTVFQAKRLEVGDVWDTQRSRRNTLHEARRNVLVGFTG